MASQAEIAEKERRARRILEEQDLGALVLSTQANFAWITCGGDNHVSIASEGGVASAVITPDDKFIVCDNIEAGRIADEEVEGRGFHIESYNWWEDRKMEILERLAGGKPIGSDSPLAGARVVESAIKAHRAELTAEEIDRYRWVGLNAGECLAEACRAVKPGMTELQIAGMLDEKIVARGMIPNVTLIAADERIHNYRHPIPTEKEVKKYAMLVIGARRWGLVVSATRLVSYGRISDEIRRKHDAVVDVDAAFIKHTRPGVEVGEIFAKAVARYEATGFGDEWKLHHQGGPTGYLPREYRAMMTTQDTVKPNQAFAWNPSITGTKSEDTIIARAGETEIISMVEGWPTITVGFPDGDSMKRPDILEM
ncbi:MAG: M24 family metallopeptidase [Armatimonadota bacterium]|nr:M24 family metallopeptidase [Armatimonadota bacterium]